MVWFSSAFISSGICNVLPKSTTTTTATYSFQSRPVPRFDTFSECLLGEWVVSRLPNQQGDNDEISRINSTQKITAYVQEVMRSCGGSVQGIREVPGLFEGEEEGYYLNRANDGFVFFDDDSSYSCGPLRLYGYDQKRKWISSLNFGTSRLCTSFVSTITDDEEGYTIPKINNGQTCRLFRKYNVNEECLNSFMCLSVAPPSDISWNNIVQCRMSLLSQPWMMQRAKWESCSLNDNSLFDFNDEVGRGIVKTWTLVVCFSSDDEYGSYIVPEAIRISESSIAVSVGGVCSKSGYIKSVVRQYCSKEGSLQSVAWLKGTTKM
jgi:hypothetical protein